MKLIIRRIDIINTRVYEIGDTVRIKLKEGHYRDYPITEIREVNEAVGNGLLFQGYQLWSGDIQLAWVPYHTVQIHFYKVEEAA